MPVHLKELALSVAQCPELGRVNDLQPNGRPHPCHDVVHAQDSHGGPFQVPEAWAGNLEQAKVVFLSSNPAISAGQPDAKLASKRIAEKYPTVDWDEDTTADFMTRRFSSEKGWVIDRRHLKEDCSRGSQEPYWGWIMRQTQALLGPESIWHEDAVMTEVVHCKSNKEQGVREAALHCSTLHMGRILSATSAGLVVVVGDKARKAFQQAYPELLTQYTRFGTDEPDGRPDPAQNIFPMDIGGQPRLVCFLWHYQAGSLSKKITNLPDLYPQDFDRLQAAAGAQPCDPEPVVYKYEGGRRTAADDDPGDPMSDTAARDFDQDLKGLLAGIDSRLPKPFPEWPGGYPDQVEAALIDAVLSIRARYGKADTGVRAAVSRYKDAVGDQTPNSLSRLAEFDAVKLAEVLHNHQMTGAETKASAIVHAARTLSDIGVEAAANIDPKDPGHKAAYVNVPGLGPVTWYYFTMLIGAQDVKPDEWLKGFVELVLETPMLRDTEYVRRLVNAAAAKLGVDPRVLDHAIWLYMRSREAEGGLPQLTDQ